MRTPDSLFDTLSRINRRAYRDRDLLSNPILAKLSSSCGLLDRWESGTRRPVKPIKIIQYLFEYFARSLYLFAVGLANAAIVRRLVPRGDWPRDGGQRLVIDTYFLIHAILANGRHADSYFPGLDAYLRRRGIPFVYAPKWVSAEKPRRVLQAARILRDQGVPVLSQHHLFGWRDALDQLRFILVYPFKVLLLARGLDAGDEDLAIVRDCLLESLRYDALEGFNRQLFGRRLASTPGGPIKCVSWFENQEIDKNFYKGLRQGTVPVAIYGCQLFLWSQDTMLFMRLDPAEVPLGLAPDTVLVNGEHYLKDAPAVPYRIGPSLRYANVFKGRPRTAPTQRILVVLSYYDYEIFHILGLVKKLGRSAHTFVVKFHPGSDAARYAHLLDFPAEVSRESIYDLLPTVDMALGSQSGALLEAMAIGVPIVSIPHPRRVTHTLLPDFAENALWRRARTPEEIEAAITAFAEQIEHAPETAERCAARIVAAYFSPTSDAAIASALDL